jgi:hypothetical protein
MMLLFSQIPKWNRLPAGGDQYYGRVLEVGATVVIVTDSRISKGGKTILVF